MRFVTFSLALVVALLTLASIGCAVTEEEAEQAEFDIADRPIDVRVTATRLMEDYENNTVAANQQYNGKVLAVSGTVESVSRRHGRRRAIRGTEDGRLQHRKRPMLLCAGAS